MGIFIAVLMLMNKCLPFSIVTISTLHIHDYFTHVQCRCFVVKPDKLYWGDKDMDSYPPHNICLYFYFTGQKQDWIFQTSQEGLPYVSLHGGKDQMGRIWRNYQVTAV